MSTAAAERQRQYRERHPDRQKETRRRYYEANVAKICAKQRAYYAANADSEREKAKARGSRNASARKDREANRSDLQKTAAREKRREWYAANRESVLSSVAAYRENNPSWFRDYYQANAEAERQRRRDYYQANAEAERQKSSDYRARHPEKNADQSARRRSSQGLATPPWACRDAILQVYRVARELTQLTGIAWHVDHIVPLRSPLVCGLHWEGNLEPTPSTVNLSKSNRTWPDAP